MLINILLHLTHQDQTALLDFDIAFPGSRLMKKIAILKRVCSPYLSRGMRVGSHVMGQC